MKSTVNRISRAAATGLAAFLAAGCQTIVRENIISSIDTGVGATLAENKQTQLYELKAGYIRSQFYSIPTGKLVDNSNGTNDTAIVTSPGGAPTAAKISNAANITPQVVSGIKQHSGIGDLLLGMDVSENFAVGEVAVNSDAAVAMYISIAEKTNNASAASAAIQAKAMARSEYQYELRQAVTNGISLQREANALVDKLGTKPKFTEALQAGVDTGVLSNTDVINLGTSLSDPPSQANKNDFKSYLLSSSPERNKKLEALIRKLRDITGH